MRNISSQYLIRFYVPAFFAVVCEYQQLKLLFYYSTKLKRKHKSLYSFRNDLFGSSIFKGREIETNPKKFPVDCDDDEDTLLDLITNQC